MSSAKYVAAHVSPQGPGDARPTALDIIKDEDLIGKLSDKVIMITGCSSGIGIETARALYQTGAHLILTVRDDKKGSEVVNDIITNSPVKGGNIELLHLELDSLAQIRQAATQFLSNHKQLNILINNAGVMACPEGTTKDGFETQLGTNHLGHFLLFQLLKPTLLASSTPAFKSRVVSLTSAGHQFSPVHFDDLNLKKMGYQQWVAYGQAKTANIYLATEIERRYGSKGLHATAVHPGGIHTNLARHLDPEFLKTFITPEIIKQMKDVQQGAATTVWAAVGAEWEGRGGKYLENCSISPPVASDETGMSLRLGYKSYAYDQEAATKLWNISNELVGLGNDA